MANTTIDEVLNKHFPHTTEWDTESGHSKIDCTRCCNEKQIYAAMQEWASLQTPSNGLKWIKASEGFYPTVKGSYFFRHPYEDGRFHGFWMYVVPEAIDKNYYKKMGYEYLDESTPIPIQTPCAKTPEELKVYFENNFDCYTEMGVRSESGEVDKADVQAMTFDRFKKALNELSGIQTPCVEWTRVEDGLPGSVWNDTEQEYYKRFSEQVNVFIDNGRVATCAYNRESKKWFTGGLTEELGYRELERTNVTHWMPLPTKPNL
jgi:hypothetical protein